MEGGKKTFTIAIEGCCHGELDKIYATLQHLERVQNKKVDLLICCGDFQAVRNLDDLETMAVPQKYRQIMTFYKYYSGEAVAPVPTLFIGGNHEAPNYMSELFYGGWAAPNIYFLGFAGAVRFGGRRIAGISGTFSDAHYRMGHFEKPPYNAGSMRSAYHVRELEVFRLMQLRRPTDVFLSHDWPQWITHWGDRQALFRKKPYFEKEAERGDLGSPPLLQLLQELQPSYWFSAHLHCKFAAVMPHNSNGGAAQAAAAGPIKASLAGSGGNGSAVAEDGAEEGAGERGGSGQPSTSGASGSSNGGTRVTRFLALDKCLPGRDFLQLLELEAEGPLCLEYDEEWLAVLRSTAHLMSQRKTPPPLPPAWGGRLGPREEDIAYVHAALEAAGGAAIPQNFSITAPPYDPRAGRRRGSMPQALHPNPQTQALLRLIGLDGAGGGAAGGSFAAAGAAFRAAGPSGAAAPATAAAAAPNPEEIELSDGEEGDDAGEAVKNPEEIDLDMDEGEEEEDPMFAPLDLDRLT